MVIDGDQGIVRIGEGVNNHYPIVSEKRFWSTQFVIFIKNDNFYLRDLGMTYPSRIKVD